MGFCITKTSFSKMISSRLKLKINWIIDLQSAVSWNPRDRQKTYRLVPCRPFDGIETRVLQNEKVIHHSHSRCDMIIPLYRNRSVFHPLCIPIKYSFMYLWNWSEIDCSWLERVCRLKTVGRTWWRMMKLDDVK